MDFDQSANCSLEVCLVAVKVDFSLLPISFDFMTCLVELSMYAGGNI